VGFAEVAEILFTGGHEGVVRGEDLFCDGIGPSIELLSVRHLAGDFAHDTQVVQGVREIWMTRAETRLLHKGGFPQQLLGCSVVAGGGGLFGRVKNRAKFARFCHDGRKLRSTRQV
jgi:hypothetical protein